MSEAASAERTVVDAAQPAQSADPLAANPPPDALNRVAELQVTAHLMTLETGLFCVFQTPGSSPPDPATGLPGVRITPAPGLAGRPEAVSVSTFREDGWLNGTAALVRVTDGSAQILVTVYQHKGMDAAPRLQVLRLSGEPTAGAAPEPAAAPGPAPTRAAAPAAGAEPRQPTANPEVMAHIQRSGDVGCARGEWLGAKGSRQWVEGFGLAPLDGIAPEDLEYQAVLGRNWLSPWVESGKFCGSRGMALPLLGLKVRLKGAAAKTFECSYSATFVDGSETGPVSGGETCEAESLAALEAFQVVIHPRGSKPAGAGKTTTATKASAMTKLAAAKPAAAKPADAAITRPAAKPRAKV
jgi:hypothetical protein